MHQAFCNSDTYQLEDSETNHGNHITRRHTFFTKPLLRSYRIPGGLGGKCHHHRDQAAPDAAILFLLYPLWDVACTVYDLNTSSRSGSARTSQIINALLGVGAAAGIGLTVFHQPIYSVAIFGIWAFGAGLL